MIQSVNPALFQLKFFNLTFPFRCFKKTEAKFANYSIPVDKYENSQRLYEHICSQFYALKDISYEHLKTSGHCNTTQLAATNKLLDGRTEWTPEIYSEMAQLLSSIKDVESAGVPFDLKVSFSCLFHSTAYK